MVATEEKRTPAALRTAAMLDVLAESDSEGISVRGVAHELGMSRSAAHRLLQSLAEEGFATQDRQGRYAVGPRLLQLAAHALSKSSLIATADRVMGALVREVDETAYLALFVPVESNATFVHKVECTKPLQYVQPIGTRITLHAGAAGKAILAFLDMDPRSLPLSPYTTNTPLDPEELERELKEIRRKGFSTSVEERVEGAAGIAAPVRGRESVLGSLTLTIPTARLSAMKVDDLGNVVHSYAMDLSSALSATGFGSL